MLSRDEIAGEIARLERVEDRNDNQRIKLMRLHIIRRYILLVDWSNQAIDLGQPLTFDYDRQALSLLRDILLHTRNNWALETDVQRKGSMNNFVRIVLLLRRPFTSLYNIDYLLLGERSTEINIWRNLAFLVQCQITPPDLYVYQRYPITFSEINAIWQECFSLIDRVLTPEIRVGLLLERIRSQQEIAGDLLVRYEQHDANVRQPHRDPQSLPYLHAFSTYRREQYRIDKILAAINCAISLDVARPESRVALLRQLQIIGESITGKNLSAPTKQLRNDIDWALFVHLRNKISHNEWDIYSRHLDRAVMVVRMQNIQGDLMALRASMQALQQAHNVLGQTREQLMRHYSPEWLLRPETKRQFMDFIRDAYAAGAIARAQIFLLRNILRGDIRGREIFHEMRAIMPNIYGHVRLRERFNALRRVFVNELRYHQNLINPDRRRQRQIEIRLANHQQNLREFDGQLAYSEDTYNQDRQDHRAAFDPLWLIVLIRQEMQQICALLLPLPESRLLGSVWPEDITAVPYTHEVGGRLRPILQQAGYPLAIQQITAYCDLVGEPLHLQIEGLYGNVRRGEMGRLTVDELFRDWPALLESIKKFGQKCTFLSSLFHHPEIVQACFLHLARIQKYVVVLGVSTEVPAGILPHVEEFRALRNFIHHGLDLFETMKMTERDFMARYASMFINTLLPSMDRIKAHIVHSRLQVAGGQIDALQLHGLHRQPIMARRGIGDGAAGAAPRPRRMSCG